MPWHQMPLYILSLTATLASSTLTLYLWQRRHTAPALRTGALLLAVCALSWLGLVIAADSSPSLTIAVLTSLILVASILITAWALLHPHPSHLTAIAHNMLIEEMNDGLLVVDQKGMVIDANPAAGRILRREPEELRSAPITAILLETAGNPEIILQTSEGTRHYEVQAFLLTLADQNRGQLIVLHEVTERRKALDAIERANRTKSEFLANMSHELRSPLNNIIGYTDLTLQGIYGELTSLQRHRLGIVSESGRQLLHLINDLLDISQAASDHFDLSLEPVDLEVLLGECIAAARPMAEKHRLSLHLNIPAAIPPFTADARRISQVVRHLLANAIKFTPEGMVAVHACALPRADAASLPVRLPEQPDTWILIAVEDTGIGIAPEQQSRLTEDFQQIDGSSTRQYPGSGVGLTVSRHLVARMKGFLWIESRGSQGATLYVMLPAVETTSMPDGDAAPTTTDADRAALATPLVTN